MSGWRDADGRTSNERRKRERSEDRARLADTLRHRPLALAKPILGAILIVVLVVAFLNFYL